MNNVLTLTKCCFGTGVNCNLYSAALGAGKRTHPNGSQLAELGCSALDHMLPAQRGLVSTGARARTRVCVCACAWCACVSAHVHVCSSVYVSVECVRTHPCVIVCVWVHTCVQGVRVTLRKERSGHFVQRPLPSQGRPCRLGPPAASGSAAARQARPGPGLQLLPGRPPEPEGSRGRRLPRSWWLRSFSRGSVSVQAPGSCVESTSLFHTTEVFYSCLSATLSRTPGDTVPGPFARSLCVLGGKALSARPWAGGQDSPWHRRHASAALWGGRRG